MQNHSIISYDQSKIIILDFFQLRFQYKPVIKRHTNKSPSLIINHIKQVFRKLLLSLENQLMMAEKIQSMQFYHNSSDKMFNQLMKMPFFLDEEDVQNLLIYYRNSIYRGTLYQSDLIPSEKRLSIYKSFMNYALLHDLFRFGIVEEKVGEKEEMAADAIDLYTSQALSMIYKSFDEENGNLKNVQKTLRIDGKFVSAKYRGEALKQNIKNIMLIGLYQVYLIALKSLDKPCEGWQQFAKKQMENVETYELYWQKVLLRIAIERNPKMQELRYISSLINKKFSRRSQVFKPKLTKSERDEIEKRKQFMKNLKHQLHKLI